MIYRTFAVAIDEKDEKKFHALARRLPSYYEDRRVIKTPDNNYVCFYWEMAPWDDESREYTNFMAFISSIRHCWISMDEYGAFDTDVNTEDEDGCDEYFNDLISWHFEVLTPDENLPKMVSSGDCPLKAERVSEILLAFAHHEQDTAGREYVKNVLKNSCGCTDEELYALGLGYFAE